MAEDIVRVIRILEYVGPRSSVEAQVRSSIHGAQKITRSDGPITVTAVTLGEYPEIMARAEEVVEEVGEGKDSSNG